MIRSIAAVNAEADRVGALLDGGSLRIYDGELLLAQLLFKLPAFMAAVDGVVEAYPLVPEENAKATGMARWFTAVAADGETEVIRGTVGEEGRAYVEPPDLVLDMIDIQEHGRVEIAALTYVAVKE